MGDAFDVSTVRNRISGGMPFLRGAVTVHHIPFILMLVRMAVVMEEEQSQYIHGQPGRSNRQDPFRIRDFRRVKEALDGFQHDGEAESDEEDSIHQSAKRFRPLPLSNC
jgi:hypothetical protein